MRSLSALSFIFFFCAVVAAQTPDIDRVSQSKYWLRLLHYQSTFLRDPKSQVDGPDFFFSPNGQFDPRAEMLATIEAFSKNIEIGNMKQHPQCAFPERYRFLKKELALNIQDVPCPKLDEFMNRFKAQSVTLVYSSAYPNNPSSMFGHTFLRINTKLEPGASDRKLDILDYGINYAAAVPPGEGALAFGLKGIFGGYPGAFTMVPYYVKIKEYVNSESRDLWEYDLNLNHDETERLLRHVWEIQTTSYFHYFFFDENCSYQLLTLLEVAKPDWEISNFSFIVIPTETIKRLTETPGAVKAVKFRPSLRKKMLQHYAYLNDEERRLVGAVIQGQVSPETVNSIPVLETAITYFSYLKQKEEGVLPEGESAALKSLLLRRSRLGVGADIVKSSVSSSDASFEQTHPESAHHLYRLGIAGGVADGQAFQELAFKFGYHDLMNDDSGYIRFSHVGFPGITLRYAADDELSSPSLRVERIEGLAVTSLFPFTFLDKRPSWKFELNYVNLKGLNCVGCHALHAEGGIGATVNVLSEDAILYGLALMNIEVGDAFAKGRRFGPKLELATLVNPVPKYKFRLSSSVVSDLFQSDRENVFYQVELENSLSFSRSFDLRISALNLIPKHTIEGKITLNYYF